MRKTRPKLRFGIALLGFVALPVCLLGKEPCGSQDIHRPGSPQMIEADLRLLQGNASIPPLPEWSKIEKLRGFYKTLAESKAPCAIVEGEDLGVRLFLDRASLRQGDGGEAAGRFGRDEALQFYGSSRVKVERADKSVTREYAFPLDGTATLAEVAPNDLQVLLEDLSQIQLVAVPRLKAEKAADGSNQDCFLLSQITAVPSRVFDEPSFEPATDPAHPTLTLSARRRGLELVGREVQWLERVESEEPGCHTVDSDGYLGRQITSLNLTVKELAPDLDFVAQSLRFWREVEQRVAALRAEEESWKKEISQ